MVNENIFLKMLVAVWILFFANLERLEKLYSKHFKTYTSKVVSEELRKLMYFSKLFVNFY